MKSLIALKIRIICFLFIFLSACRMNSNDVLNLSVHPEVELNYLVYMAADNNLERFAIKNIKALQEVGSNNYTNIIVLFDRSPGYDKSEDNRIGTDLFYITKNPSRMNDDIIFEYGEFDMTNSKTLYNFLATVNQYYPARHTVLNIWSHGRGVYPDGIITRSVIEDYTTSYSVKNMMSIYDLAESIKKYENMFTKNIDVIQFDCCTMQMLEVAYQLHSLTNYIVGAETEIPGGGSDYKAIAEYLYYDTSFDARNFSIFLVDSFSKKYNETLHTYSYSALDLSKLDNFISKFNIFCDELISRIPEKIVEIKQVRETLLSTDSSYTEFVDLYEFIEKINNLGISTSITRDDFFELLPASKMSDNYTDKFIGLAINFPNTEKEQSYYRVSASTDYTELDFYSATKWRDFLLEYWR